MVIKNGFNDDKSCIELLRDYYKENYSNVVKPEDIDHYIDILLYDTVKKYQLSSASEVINMIHRGLSLTDVMISIILNCTESDLNINSQCDHQICN